MCPLREIFHFETYKRNVQNSFLWSIWTQLAIHGLERFQDLLYVVQTSLNLGWKAVAGKDIMTSGGFAVFGEENKSLMLMTKLYCSLCPHLQFQLNKLHFISRRWFYSAPGCYKINNNCVNCCWMCGTFLFDPCFPQSLIVERWQRIANVLCVTVRRWSQGLNLGTWARELHKARCHKWFTIWVFPACLHFSFRFFLRRVWII
jgi:hypothetical protein